jgi:hypothetical protein
MKRTEIAAELFAAMLSTPAMACIDWKAIVELDAIISAEIRAKSRLQKPMDINLTLPCLGRIHFTNRM